MKRLSLSLVVLLLLLPAEAMANVGYRGNSGQGRLATLLTGDDGVPKRFVIDWRAPCAKPGYTFTSSTRVVRPFDSATRTRFVDEGSFRARYDSGVRAVFDARAAGTRRSRKLWQGIYRVDVRVLRGGELLDRCHLRTRWGVVRQG